MNVTDLITQLSPKSANAQKTAASEDTDDSAATDTTTDNTTGEEFDTFLKLLTAQIRNQDPLAPLDSTQFVEQLATFSQLELQAATNQKLDDITKLLTEQAYNNSQENA